MSEWEKGILLDLDLGFGVGGVGVGGGFVLGVRIACYCMLCAGLRGRLEGGCREVGVQSGWDVEGRVG